jgi:hypothetical protein
MSHALKGIGGNYEINRVIGGVGGVVFIVGVHVFLGYEIFYLGKPFDLVTYCFAFPGGIAGIVGGTAGAVAIKDRNVASAKITAETGAIPAKPPEGPRVPVKEPEDDFEDGEVPAKASVPQNQEVDYGP